MAGRMYQRQGNVLKDITPKIATGGTSGSNTKLIGSFILWPDGATLPSQCRAAVGDAYPIADYPDAARVLGTLFGGDGVTTFGTPDLRSQAPTGLQYLVVLGRDYSSITRLYCGREGIYCGLTGLYCGKQITD